MKKRIVVMMLCMCLVNLCPMSVMAENNNQISADNQTPMKNTELTKDSSMEENQTQENENTDSIEADTSKATGISMEDLGTFGQLFGEKTDQMYAAMNEKLNNGEDISFAELFKDYSTLNLDSSSLFDVSDMSDMGITSESDMSLTNLKYTNLAEGLESTYGTVELSGKAQGCENLFNSTYGNLAEQLTLEDPGIPKGFDVNSMLSKGQSIVNNAYSSATNSDSFKTVKNNISISSIFDKASSGVSAKSLESSSTLKSKLSGLSSSNKSKIGNEYNDRREWINDKRSDTKQNTKKYKNKQKLRVEDADKSLAGLVKKALKAIK